MQGKLIVFEGVEGCGKTTQLRRSQQWLVDSGWQALLQAKGCLQHLVTTREPGGTALGLQVRQLLLEPSTEVMQSRAELLLYAADRAQHVEGYLKPQLHQGALLLCDRYTDSTIAYQGYGRGIDLNLIAQLNAIATDGLESDLTLWLDLDAAIGLARTRQRGTIDRIEQADLSFHQRVQRGFTELAARYPQRITRIDASQTEANVAEQIQKVLSRQFAKWYGLESRKGEG
ncbi:dTMP kinase [Leptolyngbya sp. FACHB-321]|uniref:dTMP kinase n=1 Tax=Leptolyngbya sp. FACHB-321 TaxID=2692807 RepID=UPI0016848044|nr:dTMP kinase [Leptolyngbya sp. FACHB-321]MBD2036456.1 dTMP kinase [Leptolyngbya sp. FACHB-321]